MSSPRVTQGDRDRDKEALSLPQPSDNLKLHVEDHETHYALESPEKQVLPGDSRYYPGHIDQNQRPHLPFEIEGYNPG